MGSMRGLHSIGLLPVPLVVLQAVQIAVLSLFLLGCRQDADTSATPWNHPYPNQSPHETVFYSNFAQRPKHLDPVRSYSSDESRFIDQIYEPPLQYHYLKRPYVLEPLTLTEMPKVSFLNGQGEETEDNSQVVYSEYTLTIKPGIRYQPHPAFATRQDGSAFYNFSTAEAGREYQSIEDFTQTGSKELVADDYIYQIKRLADPTLVAPIRGLLAKYIVGMNEFAEALQQVREKNDDSWINLEQIPFSGIKKLSRYQFSIRLKGKYPQFKYWLAFHFFAPVPMAVDRFYHLPGLADRNITLDWHPVGTGAYMMTKNNPNLEIVLEKNPNYHGESYPKEGEADDLAAGLLEDAGKPLPFIDKAVYRLEKEAIPTWTKFLQGYYDRSGISSDSFDQAVNVSVEGIGLSEEMRSKGIRLEKTVQPATYYMGFNMLDPIVGGYNDKARKLRQAIAIAYDQNEYITIFRNGRGEPAMGPIPPGIFGYLPGREGMNSVVYRWHNNTIERRSIAEAKQLLKEAGYPDGRHEKTGAPLVLNYDTTASSAGNAEETWVKKQFAKLGIQLNIRSTDYNRFKEKMQTGNAQIYRWGWLADYPDAENFMFLLYGPNGQVANGGSGVNSANYQNQQYDRLFNQMQLMEDSPERLTIIKKMLAILHKDTPWASSWHPHAYMLNNPWVGNSKPHGISKATLKYLKIDPKLRHELQQQWNQPVLWPLVLTAVLLLGFLVPGFLAYRRRVTKTVGEH